MVAKRRAARPAPKSAGNVVPFPPLPPTPRPPRFSSDTRQTQASHIIGAIAGVAQRGMRLTGPNFATGFHASAVDLGRLQVALGRGIGRLDMVQVESRWDEIRTWMRGVLRAWVQRCKMLHIERLETGIHVKLQTQDDRGYYSYEFDVFPGR